MWNAFAGYGDIYGQLPSARKVRRVTYYLAARNEYEAELQKQQQDEIEAQRRERERLKMKR